MYIHFLLFQIIMEKEKAEVKTPQQVALTG